MEMKKVLFCYKCNELYYSSDSAPIKCPKCAEHLTPLGVTSDRWEFMSDEERDKLLKEKMPAPAGGSTAAAPSEMATPVMFCLSCQKSFTGGETVCPRCKGPLSRTGYTKKYWNSCSTEQRIRHIAEYTDDGGKLPEPGSGSAAAAFTAAGNVSGGSKSSVAQVIKVLSVILIILSVIGSLYIMSEDYVEVGLAMLLVSGLTGALAYGIGEICEQLTQINSKIK